jgi:hypothetical protein
LLCYYRTEEYVISMDSFAQTRITFTVGFSVPDLFLKIVHGGHASECIRRCCELFLASNFSTLLEQKFLEKGSLTKTCQESQWLNWRCFCFVSMSKRLIINPTWPRPTLDMGILLVRRLRARTRESLSECTGPYAQLRHYSCFRGLGRN